MSRFPGPPRPIKSRQEVTFTGASVPNGTGVTATATQGITPVDLSRAVIKLLSSHGGYYSSSSLKYSFSAGAEFQDGSTAKLTIKGGTNLGGPWTKNFKAEVIEYEDLPKSIQLVCGNDTASQTINTVDPARCELIRAYEHASFSGSADPSPTLNPASVGWDNAPGAGYRLFVVEWH